MAKIRATASSGSVSELDITFRTQLSSYTYRTASCVFPVSALGFSKAKLIATSFEYSNDIEYLDGNGTRISTESFSGVNDEKTFPAGTVSVILWGAANSNNQTNPVSATVRFS